MVVGVTTSYSFGSSFQFCWALTNAVRISRVSLRVLPGPLMVALGVWCAAGELTLSGVDEPITRLVVPASFIWLVGAFCLSLLVPAWRRAPLLATPALLAVLPWLPLPMPAVAWMWTGGLAWVPVGMAVVAAACYRVPADAPIEPEAGHGRSMLAAGVLTLCVGGVVLWALQPRLPG